MDNNTIITIRTEIVGEGFVDPNIYRGKLGNTKDFNLIPEKGWKIATVYLRPLSQKEGRTPEYKYGQQIPTDPGYLLPDGTSLYNPLENYSDGKFHFSIGPKGQVHLQTTIMSAGTGGPGSVTSKDGDTEHILRVEFVPVDAVPPAYTGPTLEEMDVKAEITAIKARLTKAGL